MSWQDRMRGLWIERMVWIRNYIISLVMGLRDLSFVAARVIQNGTDISNELSHFYGEEVAVQFENYFTQQVLLLSEYFSTLKSGENVDPLAISQKLNSNEIIDTLHRINPYWDEAAWREIIEEQLRLQFEFLIQLSKGQYAEGIANFDLAQNNARRMANMIIYGAEQSLYA